MSIDWGNVGKWCGIIGYSLMLIGIVLYIICLPSSCSFTGLSTGKEAGAWGEHEPASVCDYKVAFIYRAQFRTDKDFYNSVTAQVAWLWGHDYEVLHLKYIYDYNMVREKVLRFAVISYRKNVLTKIK